jgi:uncharacterized protein
MKYEAPAQAFASGPVFMRPERDPLDFKTMDISRAEQRVLHLLAQGGRIDLIRNDIRKIEALRLITREGWAFSGLDLITFRKLKQKKAIASRNGKPYRITERGLVLVRAQQDNC